MGRTSERSVAALSWPLAFGSVAALLWLNASLSLPAQALLYAAAFALLHFTLTRNRPTLLDGARLCALFLFFSGQTDSALPVWAIPTDLAQVFRFSQVGATLLLLLAFCLEAGSLVVRGRGLALREMAALVAAPCLFNSLLWLASAGWPAQAFLQRAALVFVFNLVVAQLLAMLTRQKMALSLPLCLLLLLAAFLVVMAPTVADLPWRLQDHLAAPGLQAVLVILTCVLSQAALWAQTYLVTGLLMDALAGKAPTAGQAHAHWQQGAWRGAVYGGIFLSLVHLLAGGHRHLLAWLVMQPALSAILLGAIFFPLVKTIVESFDGSAPFAKRLLGSLQDPVNYARGAVVGAGIALALSLQLPGQNPWLRSTFGFVLGALAYAGVHALRDGWRIGKRERRFFQGWRVYGVEILLGGVTGAALAWYAESSQLQVILEKFARYASTGTDNPTPYIIYPLFSKWGAINLGLETGGGRLLFNEALSGVIAWSLAAPLFSLNLVFLTALLQRSRRPLLEFTTTDGLRKVILQALRVERWGLWMAPIIYSFLRMAPDPEWYNQDGALRTALASFMALTLDDNDFRNWSLQVFIGLLAFDWLRILIWFDHMGLRVATLVNLSFVGGDMLDEKTARAVGYPAAARYIPDGLRRFGTWMPLLLPFYIPRGQEWDTAWSSAEQLAAQTQADALSATAWFCVLFASLGLLLAVWWWRRSGTAMLRYGGWAPEVCRLGNENYALELDASGRGFSRARRHLAGCDFIDLTLAPSSPLSPSGKVFYVQELRGNATPLNWTLPLAAGSTQMNGRWQQQAQHGELELLLRVSVDDSDALERWDICLRNNGLQSCQLQLASFRHLVLRAAGAADRHPAYNDLHISTTALPKLQAVFASNRLLLDKQQRPGEEVYFHALGSLPADARWLGYQDSRAAVLGVGARQHPLALQAQVAWRQDAGTLHSFDPCASLAVEVSLAAGAQITLSFVEGFAANHRAAAQLLHRHLGAPVLPADQLAQVLSRSRPLQTPASNGAGQSLPWYFDKDSALLHVDSHTPRPWYHPLANRLGYGAFANNQGAMYSFNGNSQQNALTSFAFDGASSALPGQAWYIDDLDRNAPCLRLPIQLEANAVWADHERLQSEFYPGAVRYRVSRRQLEWTMDAFVVPDQCAEGRLVQLHNRSDRALRLRIGACFQWVLAEIPADSRGRLQTRWDAAQHAFFAENPAQAFCRGPAFLASSVAPEAVTTSGTAFVGAAGQVDRPHMMQRGQADTGASDIGCQVAAFTWVVTLEPGQSLQLGLVLGQASSLAAARQTIVELRDVARLREALFHARSSWKESLGVLRIKTADPAFDRLVNDWLPYQLLAARLWGRHGPFQRSGAYGFRDQLQDVMPLAATHPDLCRRQILLHASQQFLEGDVLQWWHQAWNGETGIAARNRAADVPLWLPYVSLHYCQVSGDHAIWDETAHFIEGAAIPAGVPGIVFVPLRSREYASLYRHCVLAIDFVLARLGQRGLPLMGSGDWNDGLDAVGEKGRGESVWLGFFLHRVLRDFAALAARRGDEETAGRLQRAAQQQQSALAAHWRGQRYVRAITDAGGELLFDDALMSSWPLLSGAAEGLCGQQALEQGLSALEQADRVRLLSPAFDRHSSPWPGRIAWYPPGVRENGSQYSHGSSWLVDAALQLAQQLQQQGDIAAAAHWRQRAGQLWHKISPLTHTDSSHWLHYGLEPHQQAADVYCGPGYEGRGGWSWYTGSAARMLSAAWALAGLEFREGELHVAEWARRGEHWPGLQQVEWRGQLIQLQRE